MSICHDCFPHGKDIGLITKYYSLISNGRYRIVKNQGHQEDVVYTFPPAIFNDRKNTSHIKNNFRLTLQESYYFVKQAKQSGYEPTEHGAIENWILEKCILLIKNENKQKLVVPSTRKSCEYVVIKKNKIFAICEIDTQGNLSKPLIKGASLPDLKWLLSKMLKATTKKEIFIRNKKCLPTLDFRAIIPA